MALWNDRVQADDEVWILGDFCYRAEKGPEWYLRQLKGRKHLIVGNHDYLVVYLAKNMLEDIRDNHMESKLNSEQWVEYYFWMKDGGEVTLSQLEELTYEDQKAVFDFIENAPAYEVIEDKGKRYILAHAGIANISEEKRLEEYDLFDFIDGRAGYDKRYYQDENTFLITGHTPTTFIRKDYNPLVYQANGHIAIDCGCVYGG